MPPKIAAAMDFCRFAHGITTGGAGFGLGGEGWKDSARPLSAREKSVYDAELMTLLEYFNSEGFGTPSQKNDGPETGPGKEKVPV